MFFLFLYLNITFLEFNQVAALSCNSCRKISHHVTIHIYPIIDDIRVIFSFCYYTYCCREHACLFLLAHTCKNFSQNTSIPITVECSSFFPFLVPWGFIYFSSIVKDCFYEATYFHTLNLLLYFKSSIWDHFLSAYFMFLLFY